MTTARTDRVAEPSSPLPPAVAVCADPPSDHELLKAAARLSVDLNLPFLEKPAGPRGDYEMLLVVTPGRLDLRVLKGAADLRGGKPVAADLEGIDVTSTAGRSLTQPIAKALGIKKRSDAPLSVIDATAGWGEDAWLMAGLGCHVLAVERNPVVATLLRDGLLRVGVANPTMLARVHAVCADGRHMLRRIARMHEFHHEDRAEDLPPEVREFIDPDVVYLDPMFPGAATRKTAERKPLRVLRRLVGDDADAAELFEWAMRVARKRVAVKRPLKAPTIVPEEALKPSVVFKGKAVRFDVYVIAKK